MAHTMNRRRWLQSGALLTGGLTLFSGNWNEMLAAPAKPIRFSERTTDESVITNAPPQLKARLFANENPFGPSEKAKQAIREAIDRSYQYPFMITRGLSEKIAEAEGIREEQVILAAGSTPLLHAAAIHFSRNGGSIIAGDPSYDDLPGKAETLGGKWIKVPVDADYKLDLDAIEKSIDGNTKLIYICNPNNPTATVLEADRLKAFCKRVSPRVPIFIDEAYIDYLPDPQGASMMDCVKEGQNVIVSRTFSKLYGFAGLRVGYAMGPVELIKALDLYTPGLWSISATSIAAALASYKDEDFLQDALKKTFASKDYLYKVLKGEGYEYVPSTTNFVLFPIKMDGKRFTDEMMKRGVGVRHWSFNNKEWCRVSIGRMDEMEAFATAFKEIS